MRLALAWRMTRLSYFFALLVACSGPRHVEDYSSAPREPVAPAEPEQGGDAATRVPAPPPDPSSPDDIPHGSMPVQRDRSHDRIPVVADTSLDRMPMQTPPDAGVRIAPQDAGATAPDAGRDAGRPIGRDAGGVVDAATRDAR